MLIDQIHVTFFIAPGMPRPIADRISRTLNSKTFLNRLRRAIRQVVRQSTSLNTVRFTISS